MLVGNTLADRSAIKKRLFTPSGIICLLMILISSAVCFLIFKDIFVFEFHNAYHSDTPLYCAVGRGMLNGIMPYSGMYENKPPGIFLIAALSLGLTNTTFICNIVSFFAVVALTITPALILLEDIKKSTADNIGNIRKITVFLIVLLSSLLIACYSEFRSGGFQVESIGSVFSVLFILLVIKLENAETRKKRIVLTVCGALAISCAVMIKEPFLFVAVCGALLFVDSFKSFLKSIVIPCVAGGVFTVALMAVTGVLVPYFSIYFKQMFETRLSDNSSLFSRAFSFLRIANDIKGFNKWLLYLIIFFIILTLLRALIKKQSAVRVIIHCFKVAAAIIAASFCIGVGGQFYWHHYIFAVPVYCAFVVYGSGLIYEFKPKTAAVNGIRILICTVVLLMVVTNIGNQYSGDHTYKFNSIKAKAEYVDHLLDYYNVDRYQFIGFNGEDVFIGLTKHSPQGPVFGQDSDNFADGNTWFAQQLKNQLEQSDIVIVKQYLTPTVNEYIQIYLNQNFTLFPAQKYFENPPADFGCLIFYRSSKFK